MTIELAPEVERAILAEAEATGLTPEEVANRHLAALSKSSGAATYVSASEILATLPPDQQRDQRAEAMLQRMRDLRRRIDPSVGPPRGVRFRDWIHEGHRY